MLDLSDRDELCVIAEGAQAFRGVPGSLDLLLVGPRRGIPSSPPDTAWPLVWPPGTWISRPPNQTGPSKPERSAMVVTNTPQSKNPGKFEL